MNKNKLHQIIIKNILIQKKKKYYDKCIEIINNNKKFLNFKQKDIPFLTKDLYNSIIPLNLYTCWHTKDLPIHMKENYNDLINNNPEFNHYLYDEHDCYEFIKSNFTQDVADAYNSLIPCSYKSDLWRFCILYINGGIYLDIKYKCINGFKLIALTEKEYFVRDKTDSDVYTALIICKPKNKIMFKSINQIVENVKNKYYGINALDPTGPVLLGRFFSQEEKNNLEIYHSVTNIENIIDAYFIVYQNIMILSINKYYRKEQKQYQKLEHYAILWNNRNIYK